MEINSDDFKKEWAASGEPFYEILEQTKKPQAQMSVVELVFATCVKNAIEAAHKQYIKEPVGLAAFITGYLSSMRMMPKSATDSAQQHQPVSGADA